MNILVSLFILVISLLSIYLFNKKIDKDGLLYLFIIMNILSFISSFKYITISTLTINANSIMFISMYSILYLYLEKTNIKETKKMINLSTIFNILIVMMLLLATTYTQTLNDTVSINMQNVFIDNYRIFIAYPISLIISLYLIIPTYNKVKKIYDNKFITTTVTFLSIGLLNMILFMFISYLYKLNLKLIISMLLSTYMLEIIITIIFSVFLMMLERKKKVRK